MQISSYVIVAGLGILFFLALAYLLRRQLLSLVLNQGISLIERLAIQIIFLVLRPGAEFPHWALLKEPGIKRTTMVLVTHAGSKISTVFLPSGPRLFPGQTVFIDNEHLHALDIEFEQGLRMVISMGLLPETLETSQKIWRRMEDI